MKSEGPVFSIFPFALDLPGAGSRNLARVLHEQLRAAILDQRLRAGTALPATRKVAEAYGLARNTVAAAYDLLVAEGYVTAQPGAKSIVAELSAPRRGARPVRRAGLDDDRLNPQWRQHAWTTPPYEAQPWTPDFHLGVPDHRHFPLDIWRRLLTRSLSQRQPGSFGYQDPIGRPLLRAGIAQHVSLTRAVACGADDVVVTAGAQQAFDLLARLLVVPGKTRVAVEEPGYAPLRAALLAAGAVLVPVAVDEEGLRVDQLPADIRLVCVTPSHQFPTGVAMSQRRRLDLLAFARARGAAIIEDDYDGEFRFGGRPLDALQTMDRDASVFYVGTFSKSLFPSLRIGYVVAPAWAREALAALKQSADSNGNAQLQDALGLFILEGHLLRHVRRMRKVYAGRRQVLSHHIETALGRWLRLIPSEAGLHLAARFISPAAAAVLPAWMRQQAPGARLISYHAMGALADDGVVFGYGCLDEAGIESRLITLAQALKQSLR